ncbi:MAG: formyltransferase family protein [Methyloligellaceae bacterium]
MRVVILTSGRSGLASICLPDLCKSKGLVVTGIILAHRPMQSRRQLFLRKVKKIRRIGILGALNGVRIRQWFRQERIEDIGDVARAFGIPLHETDIINSELTRKLLREANADLGLSLGNPYIGEAVFSIPRQGMINIHGEVLPQFQGAQSVIWPIHEKVWETGFTIHQINRGIDKGSILYQEVYPIEFARTLRETVEINSAHTTSKIPAALVHVCEGYEEIRRNARKQENGKSYTTPTIWQFLRMTINNRRMYRKSRQQPSLVGRPSK